MKLFAAGLFYLVFLNISACNKELTADNALPAAEQVLTDVPYGTDAAQKMDIYLPAERTSANTKVIVLIHGGSWNGGDKADFRDAIAVLRSQLTGYAIFNINYRLANNGLNRFPAQPDDVEKAISFIKEKATEYRINPAKTVLVGASAGAHLALLKAYKNNGDGSIKAVIDLFGPTDLSKLYNEHPVPTASQPVLVNFLGATPAGNPTIYQEASPINYVSAQSVPTQIFHGDADYIVPVVQSTALKVKLQSFNAKVEMIVYPGESHGWSGNNLIDTYTKAVAFIQQNVQ